MNRIAYRIVLALVAIAPILVAPVGRVDAARAPAAEHDV